MEPSSNDDGTTSKYFRKSIKRKNSVERAKEGDEGDEPPSTPTTAPQPEEIDSTINSFNTIKRRRSPRIVQRAVEESSKQQQQQKQQPEQLVQSVVAAAAASPKATTPKKKKQQTKRNNNNKKSSATLASAPRTQSFAPLTTVSSPIGDNMARENNDQAPPPPPHTLILGTHPSVESLKQAQYYGHPMNAFWWIVGDCLGFRRASGISESTGKPYQFTQHLRHAQPILSYPQQLQTLLRHGFCLWDVVASCQRPGSSLDQDIRHEVPNDIPSLCETHSTIRRIVLANGGIGCKLFIRHFKEWMERCTATTLDDDDTINFQAGSDAVSQKDFAKLCQSLQDKKKKLQKQQSSSTSTTTSPRTITLVSAISVSPAAARFTYLDKRNFWEANVYQPGLQDYHRQQQQEQQDEEEQKMQSCEQEEQQASPVKKRAMAMEPCQQQQQQQQMVDTPTPPESSGRHCKHAAEEEARSNDSKVLPVPVTPPETMTTT